MYNTYFKLPWCKEAAVKIYICMRNDTYVCAHSGAQ